MQGPDTAIWILKSGIGRNSVSKMIKLKRPMKSRTSWRIQMQLRNEIPDTFWSLFRSVNREIYIDALLYINEEYQYNNYFLTKEACIQILGDMNAGKRYELQWEESESEFDMLETPSSRILNWLLRTGWLKRIEDYNTLVTNIVIRTIPPYLLMLRTPQFRGYGGDRHLYPECLCHVIFLSERCKSQSGHASHGFGEYTQA